MPKSKHRLCLNMIVKNEAPVIARCLASARPIIDYWVIVDTGSTDGTQDAIRTLMADLPGELHERPWRDFAHNRTEALELARPHGEYVLIIDADDVLEFEPQFKMPPLQADSYMLRVDFSSISYSRTQIVRAALPWRWRGVLHEILTCGDVRVDEKLGLLDDSRDIRLEGLWLRVNHDGARRRDPQTFRRDAEILSAALQTESDPFMRSRYQFYLAQSYRDCGEYEKALQAHLKRAELGVWVEEVFVSLYYAAKLQEALGRPFDEVMATYRRAANAIPGRAEALHGASRYCRLSQRYKEGYEFAKRAVAKGAGPSGGAPDGLFVETWIYEYGLLDEFAVNAYWAGACQDCLDACERILRERKCPEAERPRIEANAAFARQQLGIGNVAVSAATGVSVAAEPRARYAIITPYYKEERRLLERCINSVRNQSLRADHFLVADGFPQDWIDTAGVRHFKLDRCHGDVGNTPRGVGALIAIAEEYSAIGMLDADNWLEPDHVEACVAAASTTPTPCDYVIAKRAFRRIDESLMPMREDPGLVDTSCFFFLRGAFCIVPHWAMMPKELSAIGDRVFYSMLRQRDFVVAEVPKPTVNYQNLYESSYRAIGETPPPGAKPNLNVEAGAWLRSLSQRDNEIARRLIGFISAGEADTSVQRVAVAPPELIPQGRNGHFTEIDGFRVFVDTRYGERIISALDQGWYEVQERWLVAELVRPDDRVLEAGTAIGLVSMIGASIVGPMGVVTFEANEEILADARENFRRNGVSAIQSRLGILKPRKAFAECETVDFYIAEAFWESRLEAAPGDPAITKTVRVPVFCLEDEIRSHAATVLICDIEGGEIDLLMQADLSGIRLIIMETRRRSVGEAPTDALIRKLNLEGFGIHLDRSDPDYQVLALRR